MSFTDSEGDWGEPPADESLGYQIDPYRPRYLPTDPDTMQGRPPYYENVNWFTDMPPWLQQFESLFPDSRAPSPPYHAQGDIRSDEPEPPPPAPEAGHIPGMPSVAEMRNLAPNITLDDGTVFGNPFFDPSDAPLPRPRPMDYNTDDVPNYLNLPDRRGPTLEEMMDAAGRPISYQPIFDPGGFIPGPPGPWSGIPGILGGGSLFGLGVLASPYIAMTAWAWAYEHPLPHIDDNPYPITPMNPLFGNPEFAPIAPLPGMPATPDQANYEPGGLPSAPPIQALSTAPSFTDVSPNLMGQMAEIVGVL
jgi:hypothetical protein